MPYQLLARTPNAIQKASAAEVATDARVSLASLRALKQRLAADAPEDAAGPGVRVEGASLRSGSRYRSVRERAACRV
jgi:hypothetical protein